MYTRMLIYFLRHQKQLQPFYFQENINYHTGFFFFKNLMYINFNVSDIKLNENRQMWIVLSTCQGLVSVEIVPKVQKSH